MARKVKREREDSEVEGEGKRIKREQGDVSSWLHDFQDACKCGDLEAVTRSLEDSEHAKIGGLRYEYPKGLQLASAAGHEKIVELLLGRGADANSSGSEGRYALCEAIRNGHLDVLKTLIRGGADIHARRGVERNDALQLACLHGHVGIVEELLLKHRADIEAPGSHGTPLHAASWAGHNRIVQILILHGANIKAKGAYGSTLHAATEGGHAEVVNTLLSNSSKNRVNVRGQYYGNLLQLACVDNRIEVAKELLHWKANVNAVGGHHGSALIAACKMGHTDLVELLLDHGAIISSRAMLGADNEGYDDIVSMLCSRLGHNDLETALNTLIDS
jgi:ankyrin repeat protein